jgi:formyl-CoA transferase
MESAPPLTGVTVIEVGVFLAAPFATLQLADLGAEVWKVENPAGGEPVRATGPFVAGESSPFARVNRHKGSVALDLKSTEGREAFLRLAGSADVVVENLRPGAMQKLGLGYDEVAKINPRIVYASASGWGQDGPLAELPGLDIMAQARAGIMSVTGPFDGEPVKVGLPICDLACGLYLALAITAALRERDLSGRGQSIDVSLFESAVSLAVWEAGRFYATGEIGRPLGTAHQAMAPYQAIRTSDGHVTVGAITPRTWQGLCQVLGLDALANDPDYADGFARYAHRDELVKRIEAVSTHRTTAELVDDLGAAGVPCAPIADYGAVFTDAHLTEREFFWEASHPTMGSVTQLGSPMRFSRTQVRRDHAGPLLGADTRAVLRSLGYTDDVVDAMVRAGIAADAEHSTTGHPEHLQATRASSPQPPTD